MWKRRSEGEQRAEAMLRQSEHHLDHHINAIVLKTRIDCMKMHIEKALRLADTGITRTPPDMVDELHQALEAIDLVVDEDTISSGFLQYEVDAPLVDHLAE